MASSRALRSIDLLEFILVRRDGRTGLMFYFSKGFSFLVQEQGGVGERTGVRDDFPIHFENFLLLFYLVLIQVK